MATAGQAFLLAYLPAKVEAIEATAKLLERLSNDVGVARDEKLKHAVDFAGKAIAIERKIAAGKMAEAQAAGGGAGSALATTVGKRAHDLLLAWMRAERIAYLRVAKADHPILVAEAKARVPEVAQAWSALEAAVTGSGQPLLAARRDRLAKWIKVAPKADATTSTSHTNGAFAEMVEFIQQLDMLLAGFAKDFAATPAETAAATAASDARAPLVKLGASDVKIHGNGAAEITIDAAAFVKHAAALLAAAPVTVLHLRNAKGKLGEVGAVPELGKIVTLAVTKQALTDDDLRALLKSPNLRALRTLDLTQNQITDAGVDALAAATATHLPALESLGIQLNKATDPADQDEFIDEYNKARMPTPEGKALEAKYGRLRWLHPE